MSFEFGENLFAAEEQKSAKTRFKNRNRLGIVANILTIAKTGALKTHLMYKANLSYTMLRDYLKFLLDNGLLSESQYPEDKVTLYRTTDKGVRFLESYVALKDLASLIIDKKPFGPSPALECVAEIESSQSASISSSPFTDL